MGIRETARRDTLPVRTHDAERRFPRSWRRAELGGLNSAGHDACGACLSCRAIAPSLDPVRRSRAGDRRGPRFAAPDRRPSGDADRSGRRRQDAAGARRGRGSPRPSPSGVVFVPLAAVSDPALVHRPIAADLGVARGRRSRLRRPARQPRFAKPDCSSMLDNFEPVVRRRRPSSASLLSRCPWLTVLVTSRVRSGCPASTSTSSHRCRWRRVMPPARPDDCRLRGWSALRARAQALVPTSC